MKIVTPPAISNLETLLEVAMNPEKLTTALKQMAEMKQAVVEHLDIYTTKQKADEYLSQSQSIEAESRRMLGEAQEKFNDNDAECKERLEQLQKDQDAWTKAKEIEQAALKARKDEVIVGEANLKAIEDELDAREATLQERETELHRLSAKLTAELEKMEQRKALLNAV